jgi:hypothetical protein
VLLCEGFDFGHKVFAGLGEREYRMVAELFRQRGLGELGDRRNMPLISESEGRD